MSIRPHLSALVLFLGAFLPAQEAVPKAGQGATQQATQQVVPKAVLEAKFTPTSDEVIKHVRFLASDEMEGRRAGSEKAEAAAAYIAEKFARLGLLPAGDDDGFEQLFQTVQFFQVAPASASKDGKAKFEGRQTTCRNVLAWLPGTDEKLEEEYVLVGAHFDHLGKQGEDVFNGADDNASGVAGLLAVARAFAEGGVEPRRSVLFAAFGAEEQGLRGSRYFARHPPRSLQKLVAMINLDMIGRPRLLNQKALALARSMIGIPDEPAVGVLGPAESPELAAITKAVFEAEKLPVFAPEDFGLLAGVIKKMADGRSDHAPFEQRGIPFLFFSTAEHDDYHQPTDTVDKVDPETLTRIARCVYRVVLAIDVADERPTFVKGKD